MLRMFRVRNKRTSTIWWALIVVTVLTFVGGFVFLLGAGFNSSMRARATGAVGVVNNHPIESQAYQNALAQQRALYQQRYGTEPTERDQKVVELQAWRGLVTQELLAEQARSLGLKATDEEVKLALKTQPPSELQSYPAFQTDGKFDPAKYQAALRNPNNNWAPFEALVRQQLPVRKLQERLLASIKLSEPELREAFRDRYEKLEGVVVQVTPDASGPAPKVSDADLQRVYERYKSRFSQDERVQLEMLQVPKKYSDDEVRTARELAQSLVQRARRGEDFAQLAKDYSEGPGAENGGAINRVFQPSDFGPTLGEHMAALKPGEVADAYREGGRFLIFKLLQRVPDPTAPTPSMRVAQIVVKIHPNEASMRDQYAAVRKMRDRAAKVGLAKVASENGLATSKTGFFDAANPPPSLFTTPEAADWGLLAKKGEVSPVYEGLDEFAVAQVSDKLPAGPPPLSDIADQVRQLAEVDARVQAAKPAADKVEQALRRGESLERAARAAGLTPVPIKDMTRDKPDPRLGPVPAVAGALWAAPPGKVIGPIRAINGWYFARKDGVVEPDSTEFDKVKGKLSNEILQRRQQSFLTAYVAELRAKAKIKDLRDEVGAD